MDPYLEDPVIWAGVHHLLISEIGIALNKSLPPAYAANIGERLYVVQRDRGIYPDVFVHQGAAPQVRTSGEVQPASSVMAEGSDPSWVLTAAPEEIHEGFIEIVLANDPRNVVTIIEV